MQLFTYFRSSAAGRVRIGLALKNAAGEAELAHLLRLRGGQDRPEYRAHDPIGLVPTLKTEDRGWLPVPQLE